MAKLGTRQTLELLGKFESRNVTFVERNGSWPIVWERAKGVHIWDAEGRRYLDLTAAFGVAAAGHANPRVVAAGQRQMSLLLHAMGDVHPHALKARLARELSRITFERWHSARIDQRRGSRQSCMTGKTIFCNSGFEAVEAALKTAILATGKRGVVAFEGGYHGLGYGALNVTHRQYFRAGFRKQLREFGHFLAYPSQANELPVLRKNLRSLIQREAIGAVLVEPIQVRGGIHIPPGDFIQLLRSICDEQAALLIVDEVYTGFGRTGKWFACEHSRSIPHLICLGKALTGGFPLSACVGSADLMDRAWPRSNGEAIHTSTFLGHPVGCAMALAQIGEIQERRLVQRSLAMGAQLLQALRLLSLRGVKAVARGLGMTVGVEFQLANGAPATQLALSIVKGMLKRGFIVLPEGEHSNVIAFTPPLILSEAQIRKSVEALEEAFEDAAGTLEIGTAN
jgi:4-aminobutyrate aminotransferase-like enzyme